MSLPSGPSSAEVRQAFIDFFVQKHGHAFVPSSPVVPHDDPTLLFANAGMNQFKPIFLGEDKLDIYGPPRAANSQKCIRAGGKHNDLDDVGRDTYHHTFFEMLGNWSFGDYFKVEAIDWAWELLTKVWGLDPERLHASYFEGDASEGLEPDNEAKELWTKYLPPERIHPGNKKDNFWEMGDVGPCGPCSEIHYDRSDDKSGGHLVNADGQDTVVEIWNLVFIQFNRTAGGLKPLPHKHVDTGMGFERIVRVLQGKTSNYETDVFTPLLEKIAEISGKAYEPALDSPVGIAFRAIADHARMATFAIADGAMPEGKGRGSVVRSVIRRSVRFGYQTLEMREPFLHKLVAVVQEQMGDAFSDVRDTNAAKVIESEESDFLKTIDRGLAMFESAASPDRQGGVREEREDHASFSGQAAFDLHTTFGFPIDLTRQLAEERGLEVDVAEYERLFAEFQATSGKGRKVGGAEATDFGDVPETDDSQKYDCRNREAQVVAFVREGDVVTDGTLDTGDEASVLLDATCFYAEQGGQVGDVGTLRSDAALFEVADTKRVGNRVLHVGKLTAGSLAVGDRVETHVNNRRDDIRRHHTATHLLNLALRQTLGDHVAQRGSLVDDTKTRFDFSHDKALTAGEIVEVERRVNSQIRSNLPVRADTVPLGRRQADRRRPRRLRREVPGPGPRRLRVAHRPDEEQRQRSQRRVLRRNPHRPHGRHRPVQNHRRGVRQQGRASRHRRCGRGGGDGDSAGRGTAQGRRGSTVGQARRSRRAGGGDAGRDQETQEATRLRRRWRWRLLRRVASLRPTCWPRRRTALSWPKSPRRRTTRCGR